MMRYGSIYIATNKHTGEQYVGQTRQSVQLRTSVTNAVKQKGKVAGKYTLVRVA